MKLTKNIPARTKVVYFDHVKRGFATMCSEWRRVRGKLRNPLDKCWWCKKPINDGEPIALAMRGGKKNVVLCDGCAETAGASE